MKARRAPAATIFGYASFAVYHLRIFGAGSPSIPCHRQRCTSKGEANHSLEACEKIICENVAKEVNRTDITNYGLPDAMTCTFTRTIELANTPTRLKAVGQNLKQRLLNWGYAVCDAALRKHLDSNMPVPKTFPFLAAGA